MEKALSYLAHSHVDAVLVDEVVTWKQFHRLTHFLDCLRVHIPLVIVATNPPVETVVRYMKMGAGDVLFHPLSPDLLTRSVRSLHKRKSLREQTRIGVPFCYFENSRNLNPWYVSRMNRNRRLQSLKTELKGKVLNREMTYEEAMGIYENRLRNVCPN